MWKAIYAKKQSFSKSIIFLNLFSLNAKRMRGKYHKIMAWYPEILVKSVEIEIEEVSHLLCHAKVCHYGENCDDNSFYTNYN